MKSALRWMPLLVLLSGCDSPLPGKPDPKNKFVAPSGIKDFSKVLEGVSSYAPLRRNTDPAEVADTAVFLASDLSRGVTGNVIYVDAGFQVMGLIG